MIPRDKMENIRCEPPPLPRVVLHVDLDAFFVQVERSLNPTLIGQCVDYTEYYCLLYYYTLLLLSVVRVLLLLYLLLYYLYYYHTVSSIYSTVCSR